MGPDSSVLQPRADILEDLLRELFVKLAEILPISDADPIADDASNGQNTLPEPESINDQAARLMQTYGDSILRMAYSYLHNISDAEEVLQDTLIQFLKTMPELTNAGQEKAWLLRVAGNLAKNRINYNSVRETDELNETLAAEGREDLSFVWDAVKQLPDKYRLPVHLFYHEGYSTKEIADIIGRKESTIRSDLRRGREQLKSLLKEAFDFE